MCCILVIQSDGHYGKIAGDISETYIVGEKSNQGILIDNKLKM